MQFSKIFLSETSRPRAFTFGIMHHLEVLDQICSNYAPGVATAYIGETMSVRWWSVACSFLHTILQIRYPYICDVIYLLNAQSVQRHMSLNWRKGSPQETRPEWENSSLGFIEAVHLAQASIHYGVMCPWTVCQSVFLYQSCSNRSSWLHR